MSNEELVKMIQSGDEVARDQLCRQNTGLVWRIAKRLSGLGEFEDRTQDGFIGLLEAVDSYDPDRGIKFTTYAEDYIFMRIYQGGNFTVRLPEYMKVKAYQYRQYVDRYRQEYGTDPEDSDLLIDLEISEKELQTIRAAVIASTCTSLQAATGEDQTLEDTIPDPEDIENAVIESEYQTELQRTIWKEVDSLPGDQAAVIRGKYQEGKTITELSKTISQARNEEGKALRTLRKSGNLLPYYEDIRHASMIGVGVRRFNRTWTSSTERAALLRMGIRV